MGEHRGEGWGLAEGRRQRATEEIAKIAGIAEIEKRERFQPYANLGYPQGARQRKTGDWGNWETESRPRSYVQ
jgi:hypothetical protein